MAIHFNQILLLKTLSVSQVMDLLPTFPSAPSAQDVSPEKLMALFQQAEQMERALKQIEALGKARVKNGVLKALGTQKNP